VILKPAAQEDAAPGSIPQTGRLARSAAAIVYPGAGVELVGVWLEDEQGKTAAAISVNQAFSICYAIRFSSPIDRPLFGIRLNTTRGDCLIATNTRMMQMTAGAFSAGETVVVRWPILPGLGVGDYFVSCGCSLEEDIYRFLMREVDGYQFSIIGESRQAGLCCLSGVPQLARIA
jgi:hypothetical protein